VMVLLLIASIGVEAVLLLRGQQLSH